MLPLTPIDHPIPTIKHTNKNEKANRDYILDKMYFLMRFPTIVNLLSLVNGRVRKPIYAIKILPKPRLGQAGNPSIFQSCHLGDRSGWPVHIHLVSTCGFFLRWWLQEKYIFHQQDETECNTTDNSIKMHCQYMAVTLCQHDLRISPHNFPVRVKIGAYIVSAKFALGAIYVVVCATMFAIFTDIIS